MRTISPELEALLRSRFQAAGSGYGARLEVDTPSIVPAIALVQSATAHNTQIDATLTVTLGAAPTEGNLLVAVEVLRGGAGETSAGAQTGWTLHTSANTAGVSDAGCVDIYSRVVVGGDTAAWTFGGYGSHRKRVVLMEFSGVGAAVDTDTISLQTGTALATGSVALTGSGVVVGAFIDRYVTFTPGAGWTEVFDGNTNDEYQPSIEVQYRVATGAGSYTPAATASGSDNWSGVAVAFAASAPPIVTTAYPPRRVNLNKNLRMGPDQATVELVNEDLALGFGPTSIFPTNSRCRVYEWYGDPDDAVLTFTGVIDKVDDNRDPLRTTLTCRSMAGPILVDQTFATSAPQGADEAGAVRNPDNGVYTDTEVDSIVGDILNRAGWPLADRVITPTSFVLDEFLVEDGATWWDTLARLAGFVGYTQWDDEDGVYHFATLGDQAAVDETLTADYEYEIGAA